MSLEQYLKHFIEGYLFEDLRSMAAVKLAPTRKYGGVGYPMVMSTLAGIEVLGVLTSDKEFTGWKGNKSFRDFWRDYLYPHRPERQDIGGAIYELVRHGLVHSYITKPSFTVTKCNHSAHMCWLEETF